MNDTKCYLLTERELLELLYDQNKLEILEAYGVDNWGYYGECFEDERVQFQEDYPEDCPDTEDWFDIVDVYAHNRLSDYTEFGAE